MVPRRIEVLRIANSEISRVLVVRETLTGEVCGRGEVDEGPLPIVIAL